MPLGWVTPQAHQALLQIGQVVHGAAFCGRTAARSSLRPYPLLQFVDQLGRVNQAQYLSRRWRIALNKHFGREIAIQGDNEQSLKIHSLVAGANLNESTVLL